MIQVAGTHGKTSVAAFLAAVFQAVGLRVGLCVSGDHPDPAEAIHVQGQPASSLVLSALLSAALEPYEESVFGPGRPTVQEAVLAMALAHFARSGLDLAVLEATTSHRWDPTNFLRPWLALLTRVEAGDRTAALAWEAGRLARPGVPILTTALEDEALESLARSCRGVGAALVLVDPDDVKLLELRWDRAVWRSRSDPFGLGPFETPFMGVYQAANLALALAALAELFGGLPLTREAVREGLSQAQIPGRFELLCAGPRVVADAAQDLAAAHAVLRSVEALPLPPGRRTLLLAHPQGRLGKAMAEIFRPLFHRVMMVPPAELPLRVPRAVRELCGEDFLLILAPPAVLREVGSVVRGHP